MQQPVPAQLVLASTSAYRRELLARLRIPFEVISPRVDETPHSNELPGALALRLASSKAHAVRAQWPDALIVGSDQVAVVDDFILGKPGDFANARIQLTQMRGKPVYFHTALCLLNSRSGKAQTALVPVTVHMRDYTDEQIERYLHAEQPYDCAGSAKIEGLGISMVDRLEGDDPTALIGLPLIALSQMLRNEGVELP